MRICATAGSFYNAKSPDMFQALSVLLQGALVIYATLFVYAEHNTWPHTDLVHVLPTLS